MMKNFSKRKFRDFQFSIVILISVLIYPTIMKGQIVSNNAFLQGTYLEVGVGVNGNLGTAVNAPAAYHPRSGLSANPNFLGIVADSAGDGWSTGTPNFFGDYFMGVTSSEGFGIKAGGTSYNNMQGSTPAISNGTNSLYSNANGQSQSTWQGQITSGSGNGLTVQSKMVLPLNKYYVINEITITNTSAATINDVYFMRLLNPSPDVASATGGSGTRARNTNTIISNNVTGFFNQNNALIRGVSSNSSTYIGLGAIDCRARVARGSLLDAQTLYNGTNGWDNNMTARANNDDFIGIAFTLGNLAPGQSANLKLVYILKQSVENAALAETGLTFFANGTSLTSGTSTQTCSGQSFPLQIVNTSGYSGWTWSPSTGLNTTSGSSVIATITSPQTYSVSGTGICGSTTLSITLNPVSLLAPGPAGAITGSAIHCAPINGLTYSVAPIQNVSTYNWTLPPGAAIASGAGTNSITVNFTASAASGPITVSGSNVCGTGTSSSSNIVVSCAPLAIASLPTTICSGSTIAVPFNTGTTYNSGNIFTAQLSNASGSFASPINIGTLSGTTSGTINATIPTATPAGSGYRIRVVSSSPVQTSADNGADIQINKSPAITCPSNITSGATVGQCGKIINFNATATGTPSPTLSYSTASGSFFPVGQTPVIATATNSCGTSTCTFNVTITDQEPPIAYCKNISTYLSASGSVTILGFETDSLSNDNCGISSYSVSPNTFSCQNLGQNTVTMTVTDANGNASSCTSIVTVIDTVKPTANCKNITVSLGGNGTVVISGSQIDNGSFDACGISTMTVSPSSFNCANIGSNTVTFTVTDGSGNSNSCTAIVTVQDNANPSISAPAAISTNTNSGCTATNVALGTPITSDNCSVASITNNAPTVFPIGSTIVTWIVTDVNGNSSSSNQTVTVVDNQAPSITPSSNISVNITSGCTKSVSVPDATIGDNCTVGNLSFTMTGATTLSATSGQVGIRTFNKGITTITYTLSDAAGNTSTASMTVTVIDAIAPTLVPASNISQNLISGCTKSITVGNSIFADNCLGAVLTHSASGATIFSGTGQVGTQVFNLGTTTILYTVTDASGNTTSASRTVTLNDNINPSISAPSSVSVNTNSGCTATGVSLGTPTTADNCSVTSVTNDAPSSFPLGNTTVTWTVTDGSGNTATATQIVTVTDNVNPTITAPSALSANTNSGCTATGVALGTPTTADNCSVASVTNNAPSAFPLGNTTVTWTVTDGSGNTATATQIVTVTDNVNPTITAPSAVSANTNSGCTATGVALGTPSTADNCSVASVTNNAPSAFPLGNTTVTWTVTDGSGNT
ncbi:MAG: hypothetical protein RL491_1038, partial [Bacteroidota bacterium]